MPISEHALCLRASDDSGELFQAGVAQSGDAAKFPEKLLRGAGANPRYIQEFAVQLAGRAPLPMERHGEAMRLVANLLDEMQNGGVFFQSNRILLLS